MKRVIALVFALLLLLLMSAMYSSVFGFIKDLKSNSILNHSYAKLGVITGFDYEKDLVLISDWNGKVWPFKGVEDWELHDYVDMVFYDNDTPDTIYDDVVISAVYERVDLVCAQISDSIENLK